METDTVSARKKKTKQITGKWKIYWHNFDVCSGKISSWSSRKTTHCSYCSIHSHQSRLLHYFHVIFQSAGITGLLRSSWGLKIPPMFLRWAPIQLHRERTHIHTTSPTESLWVRRFDQNRRKNPTFCPFHGTNDGEVHQFPTPTTGGSRFPCRIFTKH